MMASMFAVLNPDSSTRVQQEKMDAVGAYIRLHRIPYKIASRVLAFYRRQVNPPPPLGHLSCCHALKREPCV